MKDHLDECRLDGHCWGALGQGLNKGADGIRVAILLHHMAAAAQERHQLAGKHLQ